MRDDKALKYVNRKRTVRRYPLKEWLSDNVELIASHSFALAIGFCLGALAVMIQHQHQIIALLDQTK